ncbi:MAG: hypothetical protein BWY99_01460 [Synergistetes bacterium ADurb.BinA166]|nr:MAG: hypothetical protein BWY99_01460 [Synergistetes bacterium ADurb.BinA166]
MSRLRKLALPTPTQNLPDPSPPKADELPVRPTKARTRAPAPAEPAPAPAEPAPTPAPEPPRQEPPRQDPAPSFSVDEDPLFQEMSRISEASTGTSSFEQFLPDSYKARLAAERPGPTRAEDDERSLKIIRAYREEFGKELAVPKDEVLDAMSSEEIADELARVRGGVSKGVTKDAVAGAYFALTKTAEASAPAFGVHLYGLTSALKQNKVVDDCLRCATCEIRATMTGQMPWYYALPLATTQAAVEIHFAHEAEKAARDFLSKPLPKREIVSAPQKDAVDSRSGGQAVAPRAQRGANAPAGNVGEREDDFVAALNPVC